MKRIAFVAVKGGTGRTTTAVHVAHGLALAGHRVALVDADPRNGVAACFGVEPGPGLAELLQGDTAHGFEVRHGLLLIASGGAALSRLDADLAAGRRSGPSLDRLFESLAACDVVLFDGAAACAAVQRLVLQACSTWMVPFGADVLGLAAVRSGLAELRSMRVDVCDAVIELLPTFHDPDAPFEATLVHALATEFADLAAPCRIRHSNALRAAPAQRGTVFESDPWSEAASDHARLVESLLGRAA